jgi:transcription elongation GreA/GreB family factor
LNKAEIIASLLDRLREEFESRNRSSKNVRDGGNDAESKATSKYDTLAIEENYLADGLARQAQAAAEAIKEIEKMRLRSFGTADPIDIGALVELDFSGEKEWFFLVPAAGGAEISHQGTTVVMITPESPLGSQLPGRRAGDRIPVPSAKVLQVA